jgi:hypothetical protein
LHVWAASSTPSGATIKIHNAARGGRRAALGLGLGSD